eukprot:s3167_g6.t1
MFWPYKQVDHGSYQAGVSETPLGQPLSRSLFSAVGRQQCKATVRVPASLQLSGSRPCSIPWDSAAQ